MKSRLLGLVAMLLVAAGCLCTPEAALAQTASPPPAAGQTQAGPPAPAPAGPPALPALPTPEELAKGVFTAILLTLLQEITSGLHDVIGAVMSSSVNVITQTPPAASYGSASVQQLWGSVRDVANAGLVLVAAWAGLDLMVREHIGSGYQDALEVFSRLGLGALLVNTSMGWSQLAIDANNLLCQLISLSNLPGWQQAAPDQPLLIQALGLLVYLIVALLLLVGMFIRLALVDVLLVVAPLALLCWVLPQTQRWSSAWTTTFFGLVFAQFAQVVGLRLGDMFLHTVPVPTVDGQLASLILGIAAMAVTFRLPAIIGRFGGDGLGLARFIMFRQVAQALQPHHIGSSGSKGNS